MGSLRGGAPHKLLGAGGVWGGEGPRPRRAIYEGLHPSNSPWIGFLPTTGSVVVRSSQGRFFLFCYIGSKKCMCCHFGVRLFWKMYLFLSDLSNKHLKNLTGLVRLVKAPRRH